jgi:uncharacterized protein YdaU (DUF1376 family)
MSQTLPWYKRDVDAWRGGTRALSLELRGFYSELLDAMWDAQGPIPSDVEKLAVTVCCNPRTIRKLLPRLIALGKIIETPNGLLNKRMQTEIQDAASKRIPSELTSNSARIRSEFDRKIPKNPMNSTRVLEVELRTKNKGDLDFEKREVEAERKRREAIAYEKLLEEAERGTAQ